MVRSNLMNMGSLRNAPDYPATSLMELSGVENLYENETSPLLPPWLSRWRRRQLECMARMNGSQTAAPMTSDSSGGGEGVARCPVSWDQVHCWPPSPAGALAFAPCIDELNGVYYDTTQNATRWCFANGTWDNYSNYSQCEELVAPPPPSDAATTLAFFFAGFCLSLFALGVAIWIFLYFKDLRCLRNTIHTNLMITYIFYDSTWILNACIQGYVSDLVTCNVLMIFIHYFYLTNFFWMFVEGLYLFILVVVTFTGEKIKLRVYISIGWGFPAAIVVTWATAKHFGQLESSDSTLGDSRGQKLLLRHCPWMASDNFDWIHEAPVITILATNLAFLISIMWVLITKLRSANTPETKQYRKATKALLVLFPLLGITYILMMQGPMEGVAGDVFRNTRALLVGLQGFTVALFYCFLNTEVPNTLRHRMSC
ncbi:hypothetical protein R5R35_003229 [Gryllus longicercus]|uniref:Diuretic hormone receptor n=1 Tax=Gryllus longicercus TaxID=2509291 RepID=A0AAN9Z9D0_9ORTH